MRRTFTEVRQTLSYDNRFWSGHALVVDEHLQLPIGDHEEGCAGSSLLNDLTVATIPYDIPAANSGPMRLLLSPLLPPIWLHSHWLDIRMLGKAQFLLERTS